MYQCSVGQGAGLRRKGFCYISCSCLPRGKIGTHCVDVRSALKNNVVQAQAVLVLLDINRFLHRKCAVRIFILESQNFRNERVSVANE